MVLVIPDAYFVNEALNNSLDFVTERQKFLSAHREQQNANVFNYLDYPFLISVSAKQELLKGFCTQEQNARQPRTVHVKG